MTDPSKYRDALAEVVARATDCMECEATGRAVIAWRGDFPIYGPCPDCTKVADTLSPVLAQMLAEAKAEALREVRDAIGDFKADELWRPGVTVLDVLLRSWLTLEHTEASGQEER